MFSEPRHALLRKQQTELGRSLSHLAVQRAGLGLQAPLVRACRPAGCLTYVCYDNRKSKRYFDICEDRALELREKTTLIRDEQTKVIDQALGYVYYRNFYPDLLEENLTQGGVLENYSAEPENKIIDLIRLGLRELKTNDNPEIATWHLMDALGQTLNSSRIADFHQKRLIPALYDYLAMAAEKQQYIARACEYLTLAIKSHEERQSAAMIIKYLRLRRAYMHLWLGNPMGAMSDLNLALTWRGCPAGRYDIFKLDELVYWEKAKVYFEQKNYAGAIDVLHELINICQLTYKRPDCSAAALPKAALLSQISKLIRELKAEHAAHFPTIRPDLSPPLPRPEALENYDSFQVNSKCVAYQAFIAKIHAKPSKNARDWEYLAAFEFSRYDNNREYENAIPARIGAQANEISNWWTEGVRLFYYKRDYQKSAKFFAQYLTRWPDLSAYELAAKAKLAFGDYQGALKYAAAGLTYLKKIVNGQMTSIPQEAQFKMYHLLRGIAYAKTGDSARAVTELTTGLRRRRALFARYDKIRSLLYWERARLLLSLNDHAGAVHDLEQIEKNSAVRHYLKFLTAS